MKKMLALTLALVMALGLCACGGDTITGPRWMTATVRYPSPMYLVLMPMAMM